MNNLNELFLTFKENNHYIFFDFEASQYLHKPIQLGIYITYFKNNKFNILNKYDSYIKTDDKIGKYVEKLTSINKELLDKEGKDFKIVIKEISFLFSKYNNKTYISYSKQDKLILKNGINFNNLNEKFLYEEINRKHLDLEIYFSKLIKKETGFYSLKSLLKIFNINEIEDNQFHNPLIDSKAMILLLNQLFLSKDRIMNLNDENYFNSLDKEIILERIIRND